MSAGEAASTSSWAVRIVRGGLNAIDWTAAALVVLAMAAMTIIVAVQVGLRYGLNQSLDWADEVSRLAFVWSVFLAIPLGIKRGAHLSVVLLTDRLPDGLRRMLFRAMGVLAMVLMGAVAWQAGILVRDQWDEPMSTLDVSIGLFMLPVVIGAAHSFLHLLAGVIEGVAPSPTLETE
jgi:TRAP-type C4-dicarboxylate transport system permease small subunit